MLVDKSHSPTLQGPMDWTATNLAGLRLPANDNSTGPWPLFPFPEDTMTVAETSQTGSINVRSRTLQENISLIAFVTVASLAMISWVFVLGMALIKAVEWGLAQ